MKYMNIFISIILLGSFQVQSSEQSLIDTENFARGLLKPSLLEELDELKQNHLKTKI